MSRFDRLRGRGTGEGTNSESRAVVVALAPLLRGQSAGASRPRYRARPKRCPSVLHKGQLSESVAPARRSSRRRQRRARDQFKSGPVLFRARCRRKSAWQVRTGKGRVRCSSLVGWPVYPRLKASSLAHPWLAGEPEEGRHQPVSRHRGAWYTVGRAVSARLWVCRELASFVRISPAHRYNAW